MVKHLPKERYPFLPLLKETVSDPYEVWLSFEMNNKTGQTVLRTRFIKGIKDANGKQMLAVFQASGGAMENWTVIAVKDTAYINKQRVGKLIWKK